MRPLLVLTLLFVTVLPAAAQEGVCGPDLSGLSTLLTDAQAVVDEGNGEIILSALTALRMEAELLEAGCINYAPADVGNSRTNPVPVGQRQHVEFFDDFFGDVEVIDFLVDANDLVAEANRFNDAPGDGQRFVAVTITQHCGLSADESCEFSLNDFVLVGKNGIVYDWRDGGASGLADQGREFFGGGQITSTIAYLVNEDDDDFILFNQYEDDNRVYFATQ